MAHRLMFTTNELIVIRESVHGITIKGADAPVVAGVLEKIYKGIEKGVEEDKAKAEISTE